MLPYRLVCCLIVCTCAHSQVFSPGTPLETIQSELGVAESRSEEGSKEILVYADGTRFEFIDGKLITATQLFQPIQREEKTTSGEDDPLINAQSIVEQRQQQSISASAKSEGLHYSLLAENYAQQKALEAEIRAEEASDGSPPSLLAGQSLRKIALSSGIEFLVTFLVLSFAFQICGFASILWRSLLLSLALAVAGALIATLIQVGPLHPLRFAAGFGILLLAIPPLSPRRRWSTAIKIALTARIAFILCAWLAFYGLGGLLNI